MYEVVIYSGCNSRQNKAEIRSRAKSRDKTDLTPLSATKKVVHFDKVPFRSIDQFKKASFKTRDLIEVPAIKPILRQTGKGVTDHQLTAEISGRIKHGSFEYTIPDVIAFDKLNNTAKKAIKRTVSAYNKAKVASIRVSFSKDGKELFNESFSLHTVYNRIIKSYLYNANLTLI